MSDRVYSFQPRSIDPPAFVADDLNALDNLVAGFIGGEQCDGCGNHSYRVEGAHGSYEAVCAVDPADSPEFQHSDPCGARYPIILRDSEEVAF